MSLHLSGELATRIRQHAADNYPHECCGALLGLEAGQGREVQSLVPLTNRSDDSPQNRYSITPRDVMHVESEALRQGISLLGWYHSHPDHPPRPSEFDREHAWPWYSYVIVSVMDRVPREMSSWRLNDDRSAFVPEPLEVPAAKAGATAH